MNTVADDTPWVLQFCHGYDGPFLDCARQYAVLFSGTAYKVCTVYLTGEADSNVERGSASDEVIFLGYNSNQVRGLKLEAMLRLKKIVAGRHFKLCIAHRFKPIYIALLATHLPVVGVHHAFGVYQRMLRRFFVNLFRSRLHLVGVSNAVRDELKQYFPAWPPHRIRTLYNRINVPEIQAEQVPRAAARTFLNLPEDAWVIGNVGRLHADKDQATLIHGFAKALPNLPPVAILAIMGSGKLEVKLKKLACELGISERVLFLGQIMQGRRYFKAFDVFVLSSDHEPFGMVLLEAMAASIPLICSDCGGGREVVDGVGQLFPFGDSTALAGCLQQQTMMPYNADLVRSRLISVFSDEAAKIQFCYFKDLLDNG